MIFLWCDLHLNTLVNLSSMAFIMSSKLTRVLVSDSISFPFGMPWQMSTHSSYDFNSSWCALKLIDDFFRHWYNHCVDIVDKVQNKICCFATSRSGYDRRERVFKSTWWSVGRFVFTCSLLLLQDRLWEATCQCFSCVVVALEVNLIWRVDVQLAYFVCYPSWSLMNADAVAKMYYRLPLIQ